MATPQALLLATLYVLAVIAAGELLHRRFAWSSSRTRKVIHIGVGMLIWLVPSLFLSPWPFITTALLFAVILLFDNIIAFFPSMVSKSEQGNWGTFYFPLAVAFVTWWFWEQPAYMVAALMPLTWGDGMAALIGREFGRNHYTIFRHTRSWEGSAAFVLFGTIATTAALITFASPPISPSGALLVALLLTCTTAAIEAVSVRGTDNLSIAAATTFILTTLPLSDMLNL